MKVLSLWEPWATLVVLGEKRVETRSWHTGYRGLIAVHATKSFLVEQLSKPVVRDLLAKHGIHPEAHSPSVGFDLGCVIGLVNLAAIAPTGGPEEEDLLAKAWPTAALRAREREFGDYRPGRFLWRLEGAQRFRRPVPVSGKQRLWRPSLELAFAIDQQRAVLASA